MFSNLRLKHKILLGYCIPLIFSVAVILGIIWNVKRLEERRKTTDTAHEIVYEVKNLAYSVSKVQGGTRGYVIAKNDRAAKAIEEGDREARALIQKLMGQEKDPAQQENLRKIVDLVTQVGDLSRKYVALINDGKLEQVFQEYKDAHAMSVAVQLEDAVDRFEEKETELLRQRQALEQNSMDSFLPITLVGTALSLILAVAVSFWLSARLSGTIRDTMSTLSSTSNEIASTVAEQEKTAAQQAAMVSETTSTVEELGASSRQSAEQASAAAEVAQRASLMTEEGKEVVKRVIEGMTLLNDKVGTIADQILRLGEQTAQIGNIANLVKDLAGETNMLALNAAVEAARAGEHGKGFAVVASEVRKLADQSKKSAEQANLLIIDIQKATNATIMVTEEGTKTVNEVTNFAFTMGSLFENLTGASGAVFENAQQVLLNTRQQSAALGQVVEAVNSINQSSREAAAAVSQTKVGIENLTKAAKVLQLML